MTLLIKFIIPENWHLLLIFVLVCLFDFIISVNIIDFTLVMCLFSRHFLEINLIIDYSSSGIRFLHLALRCAICSLILHHLMLIVKHWLGGLPRTNLNDWLLRLPNLEQTLTCIHFSLIASHLLTDPRWRELRVPYVIVQLTDTVLLQVELHLFVDVLSIFLELWQDVMGYIVAAAYVIQLKTK